MTTYNDNYKFELLQRMMPPNGESVLKISNETGVPEQTLYKWKRLAKAKGIVLPGKETNSEKWSPQNKFSVVLETATLSEIELSKYCRSKGLYVEQVNAWKDACMQANGGVAKQASDLQTELIDAASSIEEEMNTVSDKLQSGKTKVQELEEKVNSLEEELTKTKNESMKDHLTGLLTRRAYNDEIKKIESSYKRHNTQYAVVFFDLDFFKKVNDTYGHECGDVILSTFAKILEKNTRDHDIVGRYGGEEFVAIVHFNLNRELLQYLKRIKTIVTANNFKYKEHEIKVTFSAGVAIRANHESYDSALQKADMLLFEAKENGRNQIKLEDGKTI